VFTDNVYVMYTRVIVYMYAFRMHVRLRWSVIRVHTVTTDIRTSSVLLACITGICDDDANRLRNSVSVLR